MLSYEPAQYPFNYLGVWLLDGEKNPENLRTSRPNYCIDNAAVESTVGSR